MLGASCTLDLTEDPNAIQPNQAIVPLLLNSMQRQTAVMFSTSSRISGPLMRQHNSAGSTYFNAIGPATFDGVWQTAYAGILNDSETLLAQADALGYARFSGIARILRAYTIVVMVDMFGDIPYTEALLGADNYSPSVDGGLSLYNEALALLARAETDLTTPNTNAVPAGYNNPLAPALQDQYYYGTLAKWLRFANTIKLKIFLNLRLTDLATATAGIQAAIAAPQGLILAAGDSFFFRYSTSTGDPDARHPQFVNNYPAGGGDYMSNWLMWQMFHGYNANTYSTLAGYNNTAGFGPSATLAGDPRIRFYFYRQDNDNDTDPNNMRCAVNLAAPDHYPQVKAGAIVINAAAGYPTGITNNVASIAWGSNGVGAGGNLPRTFCFPTDRGYWGRDHVDPQGIPPDAFLRTAWGVYPSGGAFDDNSGFQFGVGSGVGFRGAGMQPIMMRSFVNFMLAEAYLTMPGLVPNVPAGVSGVPQTHFDLRIQNSFDDVRDFSTTGGITGDDQPNSSAAMVNAAATPGAINIGTFYPSATYTADVNNYKNAAADLPNGFGGGALTQFAAGTTDERMRLIAREYWVSAFGNGVEIYNLYRRTGYPAGLQPTIQPTDAASTPFPRSYWYPQGFVTLNANVDQKASLALKVFWDNTTHNLDY